MEEELVDKLVEESYGEPQPLVTERELARLRRVEAAAINICYADGNNPDEPIKAMWDELKAALEEGV